MSQDPCKKAKKPGQYRLGYKSRGFTLVELLVVMAMAARLLNIAAPSLSAVMQNTKFAVRSNSLTQSVHFGRMEAVKRRHSVSMCARASNTACSSDNDWSKGWLVYTDSSSDGVQGVLDGTDTVLQVVSFETSNIGVTASAVIGSNANSPTKNIRFNSRGFADWSAGTFVLCNPDFAEMTRSLIVVGPGSVRSTNATETKAAKDAFNSDVVCS